MSSRCLSFKLTDVYNAQFLQLESSCSTCPLPTTGAGPALFASAVNLLAAAQCSISYNFVSDKIKNGDKFDFIVIGAGTAGSVVASRLSEISNWNILLLEAGLQQPLESIIPYLSEKLYGSKYDWQYHTINNGKTNQGFINGQVPWPRGKMLGGCSSINGMVYVRGNKEDFRSWNSTENPSWTEKNIYNHFKKAEGFQNQKLRKNPNIRNTYGFDGPQILNRLNETYYENLLNSYNEIGFKKVIDLNAVKFESPGISSHQTVTAANGQRYSTFQSYLLPVRRRKNLKIVTKAFVTKILVDKTKRAYGVEVDICNQRIKVFADLEVILSGGAINSPQLLMLSGIGPKRHLESKNITCKVNLQAVGKNLQDHISVPIPIYTDQPVQLSENDLTFESIKYLYNRTGSLALSRIGNAEAFFSRDKVPNFPEFQTHLIFYKIKSTAELVKKFSFYKKNIVKSLTELSDNKALFLFFFHVLHPLSRGEILLNTSNPYDKPLIDANYFGDSRDLQSASDGIRLFTRVVNTTYFKSINAFLHRIKIPECDDFELNSNAYWKCHSKNIAYTVYHPVGTTKMGLSLINSVVDNYLKVHNVNGLRVIDASIMPYITGGNTNAPTIMIGEMGASMIKKNYGMT